MSFAEEWEAYRRQAWERANFHRYSLSGAPLTGYLGLGLVGELGEFVEAMQESAERACDEMGDVCWYLAVIEAVYLHEFRIEWTHVGRMIDWSSDGLPFELLLGGTKVAEQLKRPLLLRALDHAKLHEGLNRVASITHHISARYGGMSVVLAGNIAKNHARYGATGHQGDKT